MGVLGKFLRLSWPERRLLAGAVFALGAARLLIVALPFRRFARILGQVQTESPAETSPEREGWLEKLKWAIAAAASRLPWRCLCLEQAVAAGLILRWTGIPYTIYFGTVRVERDLEAHAWLQTGGLILTGARGRERFVVVSKFSAPAQHPLPEPLPFSNVPRCPPSGQTLPLGGGEGAAGSSADRAIVRVRGRSLQDDPRGIEDPAATINRVS